MRQLRMQTKFSFGSTGETVRIKEIAKVGEHRIKTERSHNRNWRTTRLAATRKLAQRRVTNASSWPAKRLWEKERELHAKAIKKTTEEREERRAKTQTTVVTVF